MVFDAIFRPYSSIISFIFVVVAFFLVISCIFYSFESFRGKRLLLESHHGGDHRSQTCVFRHTLLYILIFLRYDYRTNTNIHVFSILQVPLEPETIPSVALGSAPAAQWSGDLLVIGAFEDAFTTTDDKTTISNADLQALDSELGGAVSDIISVFDFKGKAGSSQAVRAGKNARFVALVGLGSVDKAAVTADWGASVWQTFGSAVATASKTNKAKTSAVTIVGGNGLTEDTKIAAASRIANGIVTGGFESTRFKSKPTPSPLESVELLFLGSSNAAATESLQRGVAMARGAMLTRYLVEAPPNVCTPTYLAEAAATIAASAPDVMKLTVLEKEECEAMGMGCFLGVSEASGEPPKFIHLTYTPSGGAKRKIAIVGKGLTFDSGGYNLKVAGSMIELMKFDMGGAGATLGAARALAALKPADVEVHFIIASCENMIDARGMRPGDILVASNGKTVEILNTDAEGRLTLADALLYAQNQCGAEAIVDIATLTGACMVALGGNIGGLYSTTDAMAASVADAAKAAGEKVWRMPLEESYMELIKTPMADLKNTGGRYGGSITAALFLKEFIEDHDKTEWAHLDIAGPVWDDKSGGATGYGAQLLAEWAIAQASKGTK